MKSNILKICLFATGLSGIVAEYILSTLATYFLGDSVMQWTLIVSVMLFSMGIGSRLSKSINHNLILWFIGIEFTLSVLVAYTSLIAYTIAAFTNWVGIIIYAHSILIGILIGMEIPLVIRLNDEFEELKVNVATVIEKDYYGSLAGGLLFAFVGLPYLGLTYTPFVLGGVNFIVALVLFAILIQHFTTKVRNSLVAASAFIILLIIGGSYFAQPIILFGEQQKYKDKVVFTQQSKYQRIVITKWKNDYWLFINGNQQLSSIDETVYHEALVHPSMLLAVHPTHVLVIGGGDGCAVREVLKYKSVESVILVDLDPAMIQLGKENPILTKLNHNALNDKRVTAISQDGFTYIEQTRQYFDVIIVDLTDPKSVELSRLYSSEFYGLCHKQLRNRGILVTQAGSPYYATRAFKCIDTTMQYAGFATIPMHTQVLTMGEWGWVMGAKGIEKDSLGTEYKRLKTGELSTEWLNNEMLQAITNFGKDIYPGSIKYNSIEINKINNPVLYKYYLNGNWDLY